MLCALSLGLSVAGCSHSPKTTSFTEREEGLFVSGPKASARGGVGNYVDRHSVLKDTGEMSRWQQDEETDQVIKEEDSSSELAKAEEAEAKAPAPSEITEPQAVAEADAATEGKLIDVNDQLNFEFGKATLTPEALQNIRELAKDLAADSDKKVRVEGYADSVGGIAANRELSKERARSVRNALIDAGVNPEQIDTYGYGEANPVASNSSEAGRAQNRRVEIHLIS